MPTSQGFRGLRVYQLAFKLAMEIYHESKKFPRARNNIPSPIKSAALREAWPVILVRVTGENFIRRCSSAKCQKQTVKEQKPQVWIDFAFACGYISTQLHSRWLKGYEEIGRMLGGMIAHPERFCH